MSFAEVQLSETERMLERTPLSLEETVAVLRAAGEPTRFRLLALLAQGDLTVTDLIDILGQSQPRISRHLKLLAEAGLLERYQEGSWAYFRAIDDGPAAAIVSDLLLRLNRDDRQIARDMERLEAVRRKRAERAAAYFAQNAEAWKSLRALHVDEAKVERAMIEMVGDRPVQSMLDLGTGTGRLLELFAPIYVKGLGIDASRDMLAIARSTLDGADLSRVQVRQADIFMLPEAAGDHDLVTLHQVLHYLDDPAAAIREAAAALAPGGRLLVVDFAPHELEELRTGHAHLRLGFSHRQMAEWLSDAGLETIEVRDLEPDEESDRNGERSQKLTVTLWLARDPRMLIASADEPTRKVA